MKMNFWTVFAICLVLMFVEGQSDKYLEFQKQNYKLQELKLNSCKGN